MVYKKSPKSSRASLTGTYGTVDTKLPQSRSFSKIQSFVSGISKSFTKEDIERINKLAKLDISEQKIESLTLQFNEIKNFIAKLGEIDTSKVSETSQVTGLENVTRDDVPNSERTLSQEEALSNTSSKQNGFFKVKGVLNEE